MLDRVLQRMRKQVRGHQYVMTTHAEDEMEADNLNVYDVESVVLTGQILERQRDRVTAEWKYLVNGRSLSRETATVVIKFGPGGKLIIITVFVE